jgi:3-deoxy-manno-octulosonate cytidylyltransferase (CMP-KDO synthetase)
VTAATTGTSPAFTILIPARLASTRLPNKPLADIAGKPMIVRVAERARLALGADAAASSVVVAADSQSILAACEAHGVQAVLTRVDHASGSDRLAEACDLLGLAGDAIVVNLQGDEPLMEPQLVRDVAQLLAARPEASMSTAAHAIDSLEDWHNPNIVKVVLDANRLALYFSRAAIPCARDFPNQVWWQGRGASDTSDTSGPGRSPGSTSPAALLAQAAPLRHIGIYAYRAGFLRLFPTLAQAPTEVAEALEQLRAMWHGHRIAVFISPSAPGPGVDTPADLERVRQIFAA